MLGIKVVLKEKNVHLWPKVVLQPQSNYCGVVSPLPPRPSVANVSNDEMNFFSNNLFSSLFNDPLWRSQVLLHFQPCPFFKGISSTDLCLVSDVGNHFDVSRPFRFSDVQNGSLVVTGNLDAFLTLWLVRSLEGGATDQNRNMKTSTGLRLGFWHENILNGLLLSVIYLSLTWFFNDYCHIRGCLSSL